MSQNPGHAEPGSVLDLPCGAEVEVLDDGVRGGGFGEVGEAQGGVAAVMFATLFVGAVDADGAAEAVVFGASG
jgi:hypothetical protein